MNEIPLAVTRAMVFEGPGRALGSFLESSLTTGFGCIMIVMWPVMRLRYSS